MKKLFILLLAALLCAGTVGCGAAAETETTETVAGTVETAVETEPDPFADFNYEGKDFRLNTSINDAGPTILSSNFLIQGPDELIGEAANDAALERNMRVEELLNVNLVFEQHNLNFNEQPDYFNTYIMAGDNRFDVMIGDLYVAANLSMQKYFYNVRDLEYLDLNQKYWYTSFMEDVAFNKNDIFALSGDYLLDSFRCSHILVFNKDKYNDLYGDAEALYTTVLEGDWTLDKLIPMVEEAYQDLNGNGTVDLADMLGFGFVSDWGPLIPFYISCDPGYIARDEAGYPVFTMNNERTIKLTEMMYRLVSADGSGIKLFNYDQDLALNHFNSGLQLFLGYQRLGSLETNYLRSSEYEIGILPYPKLDELQEQYVTSSHDTAEVGLIPITLPESELPFVGAVLEVLTRESAKTVMSVYYEEALKFKYTRDSQSAQMLDLIHDNIRNSFSLAWGNSLGNYLGSLMKDSTFHENSFASNYSKQEKRLQQILETMIGNFEKE